MERDCRGVIIKYEPSLQNSIWVSQRPPHQLPAEVLCGITFRNRSDRNVRRWADLLHVWMACQSIQSESSTNPAFHLGALDERFV